MTVGLDERERYTVTSEYFDQSSSTNIRVYRDSVDGWKIMVTVT